MSRIREPLAAFPILSTEDPDQAEAAISRELAEDARFTRVRDRRHFGFRMNGVRLGAALIGYNAFETETVAESRHADPIAVAVGVGPASTFRVDDEAVDMARRAALVSPTRRLIEHRRPGSGTLFLRVSPQSIEHRFRVITGRMPSTAIVLDLSTDLGRGAGERLLRLLRFLVSTLELDPDLAKNPLLSAGYEDLLLSSVLELPNSHSEALNTPEHSVAPWMVRRAEEFLEARACGPVTVSDVVSECGCSRSALYSAFQKFRGYSPMDFLAECRLRLARHALLSPALADTVTSIAHASGFSHLGRFSQIYLRAFGERPSETLRRAERGPSHPREHGAS